MNTLSKLRLLLLVALAPALLAGCFSDDDYEYDTSGDCIISAVTLATLKRTINTTTSSGADTSYVTSLTGSQFPITIDQLNCRIYNLDSLPVGTQVDKVVFSKFNTSNTVVIRSLYSGEDTTFVYSDSTDLSVPRLFTAYAEDGTTSRTYTMELRVHKEDGDSSTWSKAGTSADVAALSEMRALMFGGQICVFGQNGGNPVLLTASTDAPAALNSASVDCAGLDVYSIVAGESELFALADAGLVKSTDGLSWSTDGIAMPDGVSAFDGLLVFGSEHLCAISGRQIYSSTDGGASWTADEADEPDELPASNFAGACLPSLTDATYENLVFVGQDADGTGVSWLRNIDLTDELTFAWNFLTPPTKTAYRVPSLAHYSLSAYGNGCLLVGEESDGSLGSLYYSEDQGRSWNAGTIKRPDVSAATCVGATANDGQIYIYCGGSGEVWTGKLNRVAWDEIQTSYTE